ncbi:HD domain-containing protein [Limibacter armeniacum]|uniref:HD domain-containing protein n=1 Tax=Limibacter armeniacum TaxID=466084 RepID=UPI002FE6B1F4
MDKQTIIEKTASFIKAKFEGEGSGHDWWHIYRVWKSAISIAEAEGADTFIVELGALLHDIADHKFHNGSLDEGPKQTRNWLVEVGADTETVEKVCEIVANVSFKGAGTQSVMTTLEGKVVQDADRLDAIGAIGIARTFAYGGFKQREIYNPEIPPVMHDDFESYKKNTAPTINHFYEKLLLLKDRMNTVTGKRIAEERHRYMEMFLEQFYQEWEGKR